MEWSSTSSLIGYKVFYLANYLIVAISIATLNRALSSDNTWLIPMELCQLIVYCRLYTAYFHANTCAH